MTPIQEIKANPLVTVLLAILIVALTAIGAMMQNSFNQLWQKLDRVTTVMVEKENSLRADMRDIQKLAICHDRDIAEIRERIRAHIDEYDKAHYKMQIEKKR